MRRITACLLIILLIMGEGCIFKPPAIVKFSLDRTYVQPGDMIHLIVLINNTGNVGLVGVTLTVEGEGFKIIQSPQLHGILNPGKALRLVWVIGVPFKEGIYKPRFMLSLRDELRRTWTGFTYSPTIRVSQKAPKSIDLGVYLIYNPTVKAGKNFTLKVSVRNLLELPVELTNLYITPPLGMKVLSGNFTRTELRPKENVTFAFVLKVPYIGGSGYISVLLSYKVAGISRVAGSSGLVWAEWQPWKVPKSVLKGAYGKAYRWLLENSSVDGYWVSKFNSSAPSEMEFLRPISLRIVGNSTTEFEAVRRIFDWIKFRYSFGNNGSSLNPMVILNLSEVSYQQAQVLLTDMLRSINVPARIVSLYNGSDCTIHPITEFYRDDHWYVADLKHSYIGSREGYIASRYYPRLYQLITRDKYSIVALLPSKPSSHHHLNLTENYVSNLMDILFEEVIQRVNSTLRPKFRLILGRLQGEERLFALFVFAAPSPADLNRVLRKYNVEVAVNNIKVMYNFYWNTNWRDDFIYYWKVFAGERA